jgi:hypothetical protein
VCSGGWQSSKIRWLTRYAKAGGLMSAISKDPTFDLVMIAGQLRKVNSFESQYLRIVFVVLQVGFTSVIIAPTRPHRLS